MRGMTTRSFLVSVLMFPTFASSMRLSSDSISRRTVALRAAASGLALAMQRPAFAVVVCDGTTKSGCKAELASYDALRLTKAKQQLDDMLEGASEGTRASLLECRRLMSLVLVYDWAALDVAAKQRDASLSTTKELVAAIKKQDPRTAAKVILELADDLEVERYTTEINEQFLGNQDMSAKNPYKPQN